MRNRAWDRGWGCDDARACARTQAKAHARQTSCSAISCSSAQSKPRLLHIAPWLLHAARRHLEKHRGCSTRASQLHAGRLLPQIALEPARADFVDRITCDIQISNLDRRSYTFTASRKSLRTFHESRSLIDSFSIDNSPKLNCIIQPYLQLHRSCVYSSLPDVTFSVFDLGCPRCSLSTDSSLST